MEWKRSYGNWDQSTYLRTGVDWSKEASVLSQPGPKRSHCNLLIKPFYSPCSKEGTIDGNLFQSSRML